MAVDNTRYNVPFRAPALPYPPQVYDQESFEEFNKVLRIYFNQLDNALRNAMAVQEPYELQVSKGQIAGATSFYKFGFNPELMVLKRLYGVREVITPYLYIPAFHGVYK